MPPESSLDILTLEDQEDHKIPDGGLRAWLAVLGGWFTLFTTFGATSSFGVFQDLYTRAGLSSASNISWIGSIQIFFFFSTGIVTGKQFDAGHFYYIYNAGIFVYLLSIFMLSLAHDNKYYQIFLTQGLGFGIGIGLMYLPVLALQGHYWKRHRALAIGIILTGSSCGGIVYPIMMNHLLHYTSLSFGWSIRIMGFMNFVLLMIATSIMTPNYPPKRANVPKPNLGSVFADKPLMILAVGGFFVLWGLFFPQFYLQLFAILKGVNPSLAFYSLTILNAASIPGRTIPNLIADKYGHLNVLIVVTLCSGGLVFAILGVHDSTTVIVFAIFYGFFSGALLGLAPPAMAGFANNSSELGIKLGVSLFFSGLGSLTGTPINGALVKYVPPFSWTKGVIFSGANIFVGGALLILSRQLQAKRKGTQIV